jgi:hypothetical protein
MNLCFTVYLLYSLDLITAFPKLCIVLEYMTYHLIGVMVLPFVIPICMLEVSTTYIFSMHKKAVFLLTFK